jgi:oxygen-independent coproporphyrinogen-3 oxidase
VSKPFETKDNEFIAWYPCCLNENDANHVWDKRRAGYYIHIPFCTAICDYCGFAVQRLKGADVSQYLKALQWEITQYAESGQLSNHYFDCGHFGGGTPSVLEAKDLVAIKNLVHSSFDVKDTAEITVEVNPISFTEAKAGCYIEGGINRISLGLQSFQDRLLKLIGRPHRAVDVKNALQAAKRSGVDNFSLDIIFGIPSQTIQELKNDLARAVDTGATHLSCFRLEIIPFTALKLRSASSTFPPSLKTDTVNEMEDIIRQYLGGQGYREYGVFNFAKSGYESIHNDIAFMAPQDEYIGFGNSSYSYINGYVYCNYADVQDYTNTVCQGVLPIAYAKRVNTHELMSRYFVLGLKFLKVERENFIRLFGMAAEQVFGSTLERLQHSGYLRSTDDGWEVTVLGRRYINNVCKEFYVGENRESRQHIQFVPNLTANQILHHINMLNPDAKQTYLDN